jgi:hypothetical protein
MTAAGELGHRGQRGHVLMLDDLGQLEAAIGEGYAQGMENEPEAGMP